MGSKLSITHIITGLDPGGAETMLARLVFFLKEEGYPFNVISLTGDGLIGKQLRAAGIPVKILGFNPQKPNPFLIFKLARWVRESQPDGIHTWMYHADLLGGLAARLAGNVPVVWALHNSTLDPKLTKVSTRWVVKLCAVLSRFLPQKIVACSMVSRDLHVQSGYAAERMEYIPNGFDTKVFKPDAEARSSVREELGLPANTSLIGFMARFDPQKDLTNFIQAAAILHQTDPDVHYVLAGTGLDPENLLLMKVIQANGMIDFIHLLGRREDTPRLNAALDLATVSSAYGEAFPLVIGEAMACEVPCVATDVGDSKLVIGETGITVPPRNPNALAQAWKDMLSLSNQERQNLGKLARQKVLENYSIEKISRLYEKLYLDMFS